MDRLPILLLAAGASSRMGGADKLMIETDAGPLLRERVRAARTTGAPVFVALPPRTVAPARWETLKNAGATLVEVPDAASGMSASLRALIAALPAGARGAMVLLADMPDITVGDMLSLLTRFDGGHVFRGATADGTPGHPVILPARYFAALRTLEGDTGLRGVLAKQPKAQRLVLLPGHHARTDLDTPDDLARWRGQRAGH